MCLCAYNSIFRQWKIYPCHPSPFFHHLQSQKYVQLGEIVHFTALSYTSILIILINIYLQVNLHSIAITLWQIKNYLHIFDIALSLMIQIANRYKLVHKKLHKHYVHVLCIYYFLNINKAHSLSDSAMSIYTVS